MNTPVMAEHLQALKQDLVRAGWAHATTVTADHHIQIVRAQEGGPDGHTLNVSFRRMSRPVCMWNPGPPNDTAYIDQTLERIAQLMDSPSLAETAVYGLSGDPTTNGHVFVIRKASTQYYRLIVAVARNADKRYSFSLTERLEMLTRSLTHETNADQKFDNVSVVELPHRALLARWAAAQGATVLVRGTRDRQDEAYEQQVAAFNNWLEPSLATAYFRPPQYNATDLHSPFTALRFVSSSLVRGLVGLDGWQDIVSRLVPAPVMPYLEELARRRNH